MKISAIAPLDFSQIPDKSELSEFFESIALFFSVEPYTSEILKARSVFFEKVGRSHEIQEEFFESVSLSFLEWFLFDYQTMAHDKAPAIVFISREMGSPEQRARLESYLFHHWSLFEVKSVLSDEVILNDLLIQKERRLVREIHHPAFKSWRIKPGQIIQTRLFGVEDGRRQRLTHIWIHADSEHDVIVDLCEELSKSWGLHRDFLRSSMEALIRSLSVRDQMAITRTQNWVYQELKKRYAKKK
ncbi:MAG: hypothetical protein COV44_06245 [Deltaproteobacteria bacterium CG11_big_fil_rev_8_21_14_0_20_45_16]|nr:MAG: hypothetical protein COV44_06245 [Deltaproteobacteria bacterium CG11_big_fil_rev_8_21_14_0_20_45_16]